MAITRGATPTNTFKVHVDLTSAVVMYVTYKQMDRTILEKDISEITIETDKIRVSMTQEESLKFIENKPVEIQIRARLSDDSAHVSKVVRTTATELLKEGVI